MSAKVTLVMFLIGSAWLAAPSANAQLIAASPQSLSFTYQIGGAYPPAQTLYLAADVPTQFAVDASSAPWLTVAPTSGMTPSNLVVTATPPAGAVPGTLTGSIIIGPAASTGTVRTVIPVSLQILGAGPGNLVVNPRNITFDYRVGGPAPPQVAISISTTSGAPGAFGFSVSTATGGNWLFFTSPKLQTPATGYAYAVPPAGMQPGSYSGTIAIIPQYAGAATVYIPVTLRVSVAGQLTATPQFLTFNYQPGSTFPPPQAVSVVNSTGGNVTFTVTAVTNSGGGQWLTYSPAASTTPASVVVGVNPGGLGAGTYYGTVSIIPNSGGTITQVPVTLVVATYSQLIVEPGLLTFSYKQTDTNPPPQYLSVRSTGAPVTFTASISGPSWISLSAGFGTTPLGIAVYVNPPATVAPGTYDASINLTPSTGGGSAVSVPVTVQVIPANSLSLGRSSVVFDYSVGGQTPPAAIVSVTSSPNPVNFSMVTDTGGTGNWLRASQSGMATPASITVSVNPKDLSPGTYHGTVSVVADEAVNSPQKIQVTLNVTQAALPTATPFGLVFSFQMGGSVPPQQAVVIGSPQGTAIPFSLSTETTTGGSWLRAVGGSNAPATLLAGVDPSNLGPGTYTGNIVIKPTASPDTPLHVLVILNIAPGGVFQPSTNLLAFRYQTKGATPAAQTATISTTDSIPTVFYPGIKTADGGSWLKASPDVAVTTADLTVSVSPQGLTPGMYSGVVIVNDASTIMPASYVPVSLQISDNPMLIIAYQTLNFQGAVGGGSTAAQKLAIRSSVPNSSFRVNTNGASWLLVNLPNGATDDTSQATLSIAASTDGLSAGTYLGVLTLDIPGVSGSQQDLPVVFTVKGQ